jgi:hypothetical protein
MVASVLFVASCGTFAGTVPGDDSRDVLGVINHQPTTGDAATADPDSLRKVDWQASQLCTQGYQQLGLDIQPAESDQQLVDLDIRCRPYGLSILGLPLAGIWPY